MNQRSYEHQLKALEKIPDEELRKKAIAELEEEFYKDTESPFPPKVHANTAISEKLLHAVQNGENGDNCVFFARSIVPELPYGLTYFFAKKRIINKLTPEPGAIAVIDTGDEIGHLAVIESFTNKGEIRLTDANWVKDKVTMRSGTEKELKIIGYFDPSTPPGVVLA